MDIPVSRLNNRMALQLPAELPLGLVFVIGEVCEFTPAAGKDQPARFYLREGAHSLPCRLSQRAAADVELEEGMRIRAGGHLAFDPQRAHYYLLARDIELVKASRNELRAGIDGLKEESTSFRSILEDVRRRSEATNLAPAELPSWVKKLAPPEIRAELDEIDGTDSNNAPELAVGEITAAATDQPLDLSAGNDLSDALFTLLSQAMDSEDDIELTPEMVAELTPPDATTADETDEVDEPGGLTAESESTSPTGPASPPFQPAPSGTRTTAIRPNAARPNATNRAFEFLVYGLVLGVSIVLGALLLFLLFWF